MAITVDCDSCGKTLRVGDAHAGKCAKCPECGNVVHIPQADVFYRPEESLYDPGRAREEEGDYRSGNDDFGDGQNAYQDDNDSYADGNERVAKPVRNDKPCPACGEAIKKAALKCRFCGEVFDRELVKSRGSRSGAPLASPITRLAAVFVDGLAGLVAAIPILIGAVMVDGRNEVLGGLLVLVGLLFLLGLALYQLVLLSREGQTIGKKAVNVRIVMYEDNSNPGFVQVFLIRSLVNGCIGGIPLIGAIYSLVDILFIFGDENRCLHDLLAGTKVVEAT